MGSSYITVPTSLVRDTLSHIEETELAAARTGDTIPVQVIGMARGNIATVRQLLESILEARGEAL